MEIASIIVVLGVLCVCGFFLLLLVGAGALIYYLTRQKKTETTYQPYPPAPFAPEAEPEPPAAYQAEPFSPDTGPMSTFISTPEEEPVMVEVVEKVEEVEWVEETEPAPLEEVVPAEEAPAVDEEIPTVSGDDSMLTETVVAQAWDVTQISSTPEEQAEVQEEPAEGMDTELQITPVEEEDESAFVESVETETTGEVRCHFCGTLTAPGEKFCGECGARLEE